MSKTKEEEKKPRYFVTKEYELPMGSENRVHDLSEALEGGRKLCYPYRVWEDGNPLPIINVGVDTSIIYNKKPKRHNIIKDDNS